MAEFNPAIFQAALLEVAEATKAAASATQAVQQLQQAQQQVVQSQAASSSPTGSPHGNVDWSKLINKPPLLDGKTTEDEIKLFRDWSWQLVQFLNAIDSGYEPEIQSIMDDPTKGLDMSTASAETRQRGAKLYGLLASLCRNRSLHVVRSVKQADGFEALRQLTLTLRPSNNNRGLALMGALTNWPAFNMSQMLQPQLLKLEEALEEARKAGSTIPDQLQQAILLKCVSGQLRTHLNLQIQESTTFKELREQVLRWDRSQQKWSSLIFSEDASTSTPMEVDRVYDSRGWSGGKSKGNKGKGKPYNYKGDQKGKVKGKGKTKDGKSGQKGKQQKGDYKGKYSGKSDSGKGKSSKADMTCHKCGKVGHFARDCWSNSVRNVQAESSQPLQPSPTTTVAGSPSSAASSQMPTVSQQGRVARIRFSDVTQFSDIPRHDDFVFDMRCPSSEAYATDGTVRVVRFYIGDEPNASDSSSEPCSAVRTVIEHVPEECDMHSILLDSGADASIFPASMSELGVPSSVSPSCLRDAQGCDIPLHGMKDVEVHLMDMHGHSVVLKETVALSDRISQPILCFGKLLEGGWSINGVEQTMTHRSGIAIPIEMQNRSMAIRGWVRMVKSQPEILGQVNIRAVRADVMDYLADMRVGWSLNGDGVGTGKHYASCYQDPSLACPTMSGRKYRTTLIQDQNQWLVLELCEPLDGVIDLSAEFHGYEGERFVLTIITEAERPPEVMGFRMLDDNEMPLAELGAGALHRDPHAAEPAVAAPLAPDDEVQGVDIEVDEQGGEGQQVPHGHLVLAPERGDHLNVNGVELFRDSALATLRQGCAFYGLSQSGAKERCFKRLWEHQKKLELQTALTAARETEAEQQRLPNPQPLAEPPDDRAIALHMLTHLPFADWCADCISHRSRPDRHKRDGSVKDSGIPTVSFDFAYTKAVEPGGNVAKTDTVIALILVDSSTNYTGCVPIRGKNDFDVMVREIIQFTHVLGHSECTYLCDNEPAIKEVQKRAVRARKSMGFVTHDKTPAAYTHGNSLCENTVGRVRGLAGTLMHHVQEKLSMKLSTNHGLWSWALRHASWLLNRFAVVNGSTPFELVYQKVYKGRMTEFAEPAFAYTHTALKGNPKWQRVIVLGKTESQDTYVVFTGAAVMLTRSVRRVSTDWKNHLGFYLHFNAPTWKFKTGFGGRVVPTKRAVEGISASFQAPQGDVLPSSFHDAEAEAVKNKAAEEKLEEREMVSMGHEDKTFDPRDKAVAHEPAVPRLSQPVALDIPEGPSSAEPMRRREDEVVVDSVFDDDAVDASFLTEMENQVDLTFDGGEAAPVTPPVGPMQSPSTPRLAHSTRMHDSQDDADHETKKARVADHKKQKINQLMQQHEAMIRVVKVGTDEFATMDDYSTELDMNADVLEDEYWCDEDQVQLGEVPDALWSNLPLDKPPSNPEPWVDQLADEIEIQRLLEMGVLQKREECTDEVCGSLTTRFVYDWRVKQHRNGQQMWMRRSRFVAREFANVKRHDTYSPASGSHTANLVPLVF